MENLQLASYENGDKALILSIIDEITASTRTEKILKLAISNANIPVGDAYEIAKKFHTSPVDLFTTVSGTISAGALMLLAASKVGERECDLNTNFVYDEVLYNKSIKNKNFENNFAFVKAFLEALKINTKLLRKFVDRNGCFNSHLALNARLVDSLIITFKDKYSELKQSKRRVKTITVPVVDTPSIEMKNSQTNISEEVVNATNQ